MLKLDENPPILHDRFADIAAIEGSWWVAHTKSRFEKALAWELIAHDIPYFLPMSQRTAIWGGRRRKVLTPLFPSYVFFCGDSDARVRAMSSHRICQLLPVRDRERFVEELTALHTALQSGAELDLYPSLAVGKKCRVARGPMQGVEGIVVRKHSASRLVLQISMLGQGASLEIDPAFLECLD
jgi:hypothetical protein